MKINLILPTLILVIVIRNKTNTGYVTNMALEMQLWRRTMSIMMIRSWTRHKSNEEMLKQLKCQTLWEKQKTSIGHTLHHVSSLKKSQKRAENGEIDQSEDLGQHYWTTLWETRENLPIKTRKQKNGQRDEKILLLD